MKAKLVFGIYYDDEADITTNKADIPFDLIPTIYMMLEKEKEILKKKWNENTFGAVKEDVIE